MINADKTIIIQSLQIKHTEWLTDYNKALSLGICPESWAMTNIMISNLIRVIYGYKAFDSTVTNADVVTVNIAASDPSETYTIDIDYGATNLVSFTGTGDQTVVATQLRDSINAGTATHNYYAVTVSNVLYLYTYDVAATYADTPTLTYSELDNTTVELGMTTSSLDSINLSTILDTWNCLTLDELCDVVSRIRELLTDCKCN